MRTAAEEIKRFGPVKGILLTNEDITRLEVDCIVNAAKISETESERRVAYEVSVSKLEYAES